MAEKPTEASVATVHRTLAIVSSIGSVCELSTVTKFFNGNPVLGSLGAGMDSFSGRSGRKRWSEIGAVIGRGWDNVVDAIDQVVTIPDVEEAASEKAAAELDEPKPEEVEDVTEPPKPRPPKSRPPKPKPITPGTRTPRARDSRRSRRYANGLVLGADDDFWLKVGIDPIRMITRGGTYYTLRCYLDDAPVFLGRNGRVSVFGSERALARYLADEHDHDLSDLATYEDIKTAATDGSLRVDVTDENVYVTSGLADDLADGPDAVDRDKLELAVELLRDVGEYAEDDVVDETLDADMPFGGLVAHVLDPDTEQQDQRTVCRCRRAVGVPGDLPRIAGCGRSSRTSTSSCQLCAAGLVRSIQEYRFVHILRVCEYEYLTTRVACAASQHAAKARDGRRHDDDRSAAAGARFASTQWTTLCDQISMPQGDWDLVRTEEPTGGRCKLRVHRWRQVHWRKPPVRRDLRNQLSRADHVHRRGRQEEVILRIDQPATSHACTSTSGSSVSATYFPVETLIGSRYSP